MFISLQFSRSVASDSATPWTVAYQAPPSMGFSRQEYWRGLPLPSLANIHCIFEKARKFKKNIYFCFIDYTKDFDCVDHRKLENS